VRAYVALDDHEDVIFTAYRPGQPYDVLTEQLVGSGIAEKDDKASIWFDVGNFQRPWQDGEKLIVIIEAQKGDQGYYTVTDVVLDAHTDIQSLGEHVLVSTNEKQDNVIGYSLYREGERLVDEVLATVVAQEGISVHAVIEGGHETVYGSSGMQSLHDDRPSSFWFVATPNPSVNHVSIAYALPKQTMVEMVVYDIAGRQITGLVSDVMKAGYYTTGWDGTDAYGRHAGAGVYFLKFTAGSFVKEQKLLLIR
jgi:hypothetical protein